MSLIVITSGADTYVHEGRPTKPGGATARPIAGSGNGQRKWTLVRSGELARAVRGLTISSAVCSWEAANDHPAHTLLLNALTEGFSPENETWEKRPDFTDANAVSVNVPATQAGQRRSAEMGALVQQLANGATHHGFRLFSTIAANLAYVGFDDRDPDATSWRWDITVEDDSDAPVDLSPDGGAVSLAKPKVKWRIDDADPTDAEVDVQTAYRVQADVPDAGANPSAHRPGLRLRDRPVRRAHARLRQPPGEHRRRHPGVHRTARRRRGVLALQRQAQQRRLVRLDRLGVLDPPTPRRPADPLPHPRVLTHPRHRLHPCRPGPRR